MYASTLDPRDLVGCYGEYSSKHSLATDHRGASGRSDDRKVSFLWIDVKARSQLNTTVGIGSLLPYERASQQDLANRPGNTLARQAQRRTNAECKY